jgi:OmpA-OmpF porin, OOP family
VLTADWMKGIVILALSCVPACSFQASMEAGSKTPEESSPPPPEAAPPASPEQAPPESTRTTKVKVKGNQLVLPGRITFDAGTPNFTANAGNEDLIGEVRLYLNETAKVTRLRIEGHTDNQLPEADALELSGKRASMVKQWLINAGVNPGRLLAVGFGQQRPIANNAEADGRAKNDRIEFRIAEIDGKPYLSPDPLAGGTEFP